MKKNRVLALLLAAFLLFGAASGNALTDKSGTVLLCIDTDAEGPLTVPDGIVTVTADALSGCTNATELILPDSVVNFRFQTFGSQMKKVCIGAGVKHMVAWPFYDDVVFELSPQNPWFELRDGKLFTKDGKDLSLNG